MIRANPDTNALEPLLVRRAEMADDAMSVTFYLREGTKWSDGHPMTADDYVFMYEDAHWNDKVTTWNWIPQIKRAIKVDDYTVRFETDEPYHALLAKHASPPGGGWQVFHPFHYLKKWHINHNPDATHWPRKRVSTRGTRRSTITSSGARNRIWSSPPNTPGSSPSVPTPASATCATPTTGRWTRPATNCPTWTTFRPRSSTAKPTTSRSFPASRISPCSAPGSTTSPCTRRTRYPASTAWCRFRRPWWARAY